MDRAELREHRRAKDEFFANSHHSPIPHEHRHSFTGLSYYEPRPDLVFEVPLEEADGAEVTVQTSDGQQRLYRRVATASVPIAGEEVSVALYDTGHPGFFLPFRDSTSGKDTYGAGRYIDIEPAEAGVVTIDFNLAYNPSCVYDEGYSCPLPPIENWLEVPIEAGEKNYVAG